MVPTKPRSRSTPACARALKASASGGRREERRQQGGRGIGLDPGHHLDLGAEACVAHEVPRAARRARLVVPGADDEPRDPCGQQGSRAHHARLKGHDKRVAVEVPRPCARPRPRAGPGSRRVPWDRASTSRRLCPRPTIAPSGDTTTAPTGTSSCAGAQPRLARASRIAVASSMGATLVHDRCAVRVRLPPGR